MRLPAVLTSSGNAVGLEEAPGEDPAMLLEKWQTYSDESCAMEAAIP
jgi:hypothetical protein